MPPGTFRHPLWDTRPLHTRQAASRACSASASISPRRKTHDAGYDDHTIARTVAQCLAWRNIVVAETDDEAAAIGIPAFRGMRASLNNARRRLNRPEEQRPASASATPAARDTVEHGLIYGSPETVCEQLAPLCNTGIGGLILHFRLGAMSWEATEQSLRLFATRVAPEFAATSVHGPPDAP